MLWDLMTNVEGVVAHVRAMAVLASEVGKAEAVAETAVVADVVASVVHSPTTSKLPIPIEILP